MEISKNVRDRIHAAADALYAEAERRSFPTVDAVRKKASVNMNDASTGMKEWRRLQSATLEQVPNQLPAELSASCTAALSALWKEATAIANVSLRAAQESWDKERAEINDLSRQMASAYDQQTSDLELAQADIARLNSQVESAFREMTAVKTALDATEHERVAASNAAKMAEVLVIEIGCRAEALRAELNRAHEETVCARAELASTRAAHDAQIDQLRGEARRDIDRERERADSDRTRSEETLRLALHEAAELRGRLAAALASGPLRLKRTQKAPNGDAGNAAKLDN